MIIWISIMLIALMLTISTGHRSTLNAIFTVIMRISAQKNRTNGFKL